MTAAGVEIAPISTNGGKHLLILVADDSTAAATDAAMHHQLTSRRRWRRGAPPAGNDGHRIPPAVHSASVGVGRRRSRDEGATVMGRRTSFEHLLFKSTPTRSAVTLCRRWTRWAGN